MEPEKNILAGSQRNIRAGTVSAGCQSFKSSEEAIKNFDEQAAVTYFNTFNDTSVNHGPFMGNNSTFNLNPIEKWLEVIEENKKLYECLLASEQEKVQLLKGKY